MERWTSANSIIEKYGEWNALRPPMCLQRLIKQLGENVRSAGKPKKQNRKRQKSRMAWNKLPRESQIFAMKSEDKKVFCKSFLMVCKFSHLNFRL